jgi:hypothetical protein
MKVTFVFWDVSTDLENGGCRLLRNSFTVVPYFMVSHPEDNNIRDGIIIEKGLEGDRRYLRTSITRLIDFVLKFKRPC